MRSSELQSEPRLSDRLFNLSGKCAVVTGGSRGIGLMIAHGLVAAGATVVISSRNEAACASAVAALEPHGNALAIPADLAEPAECERLAAEAATSLGNVHVLVNNAGTAWGAPIQDHDEHVWTKVLRLNVTTPFLLVRAFLPHLIDAGSLDDPARIINVGSVDGLRVPDTPTYAYTSSKAALHHLTRHLAVDLGPSGITVNAIAPGPFPSKMMQKTLEERGSEIAASAPLRRIGRMEDMAAAAVYLASPSGAYVTGAVIPVDGGISAASP